MSLVPNGNALSLNSSPVVSALKCFFRASTSYAFFVCSAMQVVMVYDNLFIVCSIPLPM